MLAPLLTLYLASPDLAQPLRDEREILAELVAADTSNPPGNEERAVARIAARLKKAKIPYQIVEAAPHRQSLVARLKGDGSKRPLLLCAHLDVVPADASQWTKPPFKLTEDGGYLYGRGVHDDKVMAAAEVALLLQLARERTHLARDVIVALVAGEEVDSIGLRTLLAKHRPLVDAEFALNEGGELTLRDDGEHLREVAFAAAEKTFQSFQLTARGPGGHSSLPLGDNAIYRLSAALTRLSAYKFPTRLNAVTRSYLAGRAKIESGELAKTLRAAAESPPQLGVPARTEKLLAADPFLNATIRTTCVATMLRAGIKDNALPFEAQAIVNCRVLPDESVDDVQATLARVIADPRIAIEKYSPGLPEAPPGGMVPVVGPVPEAIHRVAGELFPGVPVFAGMSTGASDSKYLRGAGIPSYGISVAPMTEADGRRAHGHDERLPVRWLAAGYDFFQRLVCQLACSP